MNRDQSKRDRARELRREATPVEKILWRHLRGRRFAGFKFRRQHVVGPFIADFYCATCALVIELDGETHLGKEAPDQTRTDFLQEQGLKVLRFWNTDVYDDLEPVLEVIYRECQQRASALSALPTPHPQPLSPKGRGE